MSRPTATKEPADFRMRLLMTRSHVPPDRRAGVQNIQNERKSGVSVPISTEVALNHVARFDRDEAWQLTFEEARL